MYSQACQFFPSLSIIMEENKPPKSAVCLKIFFVGVQLSCAKLLVHRFDRLCSWQNASLASIVCLFLTLHSSLDEDR